MNFVGRKGEGGVAGLFFSRGAWFLKGVQDETERIKVGPDPIHGTRVPSKAPPPPPWSRRLFNPWKNRKNKFIFMKNIFQRVCIPSSLLLLFSSSLSLSLPISRPLNRIRRNKKKRERERAGDWNWREIERGGGGEVKSREKDRRYFRRRLVPEEQSPPPPLASLNYARSFISGGTSVPDIFQVRWVRRRPGKTAFVARRWACLLLGGKNREKNLECAMSRELEDTWRGEEDDREV